MTANVADFLRIDALWRRSERVHHGIVVVPSASFPQDRALVGVLSGALTAAHEADELPEAGHLHFLRRAHVG